MVCHLRAMAHKGRRGTAANSQANLAANRARKIQRGRLLREALRFLWVKDEASGRHPPAKTLQWGLKNAGDAGQAYLSAYGYPNLRCVQQHLKAIRAEAVSAMRI